MWTPFPHVDLQTRGLCGLRSGSAGDRPAAFGCKLEPFVRALLGSGVADVGLQGEVGTGFRWARCLGPVCVEEEPSELSESKT